MAINTASGTVLFAMIMLPDANNIMRLPDLPLPVSGLDLWWVPLPKIDADTLLHSCPDCLGAEEYHRLRSRRLPRGRLQFVFTRIVLRHLLSAYHPEWRPGQWVISRTATGRPHLDKSQSPLSFNLTHSDNCLIIAFSQYAEPGVDLESLSRVTEIEGVARRFFSDDEYNQLEQADHAARQELFYRLWTLKEAAVKASGLGLARGLRQFSFSQPGSRRFTHTTQYASFDFWSARVDDAIVAAALMYRDAATVPDISPLSRTLRWPADVEVIYPDWDSSQSKNSSTNLEP